MVVCTPVRLPTNGNGFMKVTPKVLAVTLIFMVPFILGCVPGLQMSKPSGDVASTGSGETQSSPEAASTVKPTNKGPGGQVPPSSPQYTPPSPAVKEGPFEGEPDLSWKDEINASALDFADKLPVRNVPKIKHVKTCFSKLYGGWYLILYVEEGKKIGLQQYSWNPKNREWEFSYRQKEVPANQVEFHLKGEVEDEKCFVLK